MSIYNLLYRPNKTTYSNKKTYGNTTTNNKNMTLLAVALIGAVIGLFCLIMYISLS